MKGISKTGLILAATAAGFFASNFVASTAHAADVNCIGGNACKGKSECKGSNNACKGQNKCKGLGWVTTTTKEECEKAGGHPQG